MHKQLAHQNKRYVAEFLKAREIETNVTEEFCKHCVKDKMKRKSHKSREIHTTRRTDQWGS